MELTLVRSPLPPETEALVRLSGARVGLVVNFNVPVLREGIRRVVL